MSKMNVEPLMTLLDGSQLVVSTQYLGEGRFKCQLYVSVPCNSDNIDMRLVHASELEASTCREAQDSAYSHAMRLYPEAASGIKKPPYLIWQGPSPSLESGQPVAYKAWRSGSR